VPKNPNPCHGAERAAEEVTRRKWLETGFQARKTPTLATAAERTVRWAAILGVGAAGGWGWGGVFVAQKPQPLPRALNRQFTGAVVEGMAQTVVFVAQKPQPLPRGVICTFCAGRPVTGGVRKEERVREVMRAQ
jgi:hypothetical protein